MCVFGSTLFAVQVAHWGINYVGVLLMSLFVLLAMIAVITTEATRSVVRSAEKQDQGNSSLRASLRFPTAELNLRSRLAMGQKNQ